MARSAAAVSVEKYGFPVPAAKMTTRPFSRWRMARRRMNGSQTSFISMALSTRVYTPSFSSVSCKAMALTTVAKNVSAADHDGGFHTQFVNFFQLARNGLNGFAVNAESLRPLERFAG